MKCPKCSNEMSEISNEAFTANRCESCGGLWFTEENLSKALKTANSEEIDLSDLNSAATYNEVRDIDCPTCNQKMIKMVDKDQFHIKYELCPSCRGIFLDSGEFKDLKEHTIIERLSQSFKTLKTNMGL